MLPLFVFRYLNSVVWVLIFAMIVLGPASARMVLEWRGIAPRSCRKKRVVS